MASLNKVILLGNLGKDPELRTTQSGNNVVNFSMATTEKWKGKDGLKQEKTEWHNIVLWGRTAEVANQYLKKGSSVLIEGKLQTRSWDDKDGNRRYTTEVVGNNLVMVGSRKDEGATRQADTDSVDTSGFNEPSQGEAVAADLPF